MSISRLPAAACVALLACAASPAWAASTPAPSGSQHRIVLPAPSFPTQRLHAEYLVEVNRKGQVVRIQHGNGTHVGSFNAQTFGNAMQMWIRKPDGTAIVGLYRVSYDYDPKTHNVHRAVALVSTGGSWANDRGAAQVMMETAQREAAEAAKKKQAEQSKLPSLNQITGKKTPAPRPTPLFSPHP